MEGIEGIAILLAILAAGCILSGPIALIISIIALNKSRPPYRDRPFAKPQRSGLSIDYGDRAEQTKQPQEETAEVVDEQPQWQPLGLPVIEEPKPPVEEAATVNLDTEPRPVEKPKVKTPIPALSIPAPKILLEQQIGTRWILIAGIITIIVGVAFFLRYAYVQFSISETARVLIVAGCGLAALALGEVTRRRGYGIVAKGVTALGFAILYAAVFTAQQYYMLIGSKPAFALAVIVTAWAMIYAVALDEILIALLSLSGGFVTPVIVSTGENLPIPLFSYALTLGIGAIICANFRKWRAVNFFAFVGTFILYAGWFEKFYRPAIMPGQAVPAQMHIALGGLAVFFGVYLVLPLLGELIKKVKSRREDVLLVLANAIVTFYYLWTILFREHRKELAFCALGLCAAHLVMMAIVWLRCREDVGLHQSLLATGLFFLSIAVPLYLKMNAITVAWAAEGVVLAVIAVRYRSILSQISGIIVQLLSFGNLLLNLPLHAGGFVFLKNVEFGTWCFAVGAMFATHIVYRLKSQFGEKSRHSLAQLFYSAAAAVLMAAVTMEWLLHCDYNLNSSEAFLIKGLIIIVTSFMLGLLIRPVCPQGVLCKTLSTILAAAGSLLVIVGLTQFHNESFRILANADFGVAIVFIAGLFGGSRLLRLAGDEDAENIAFAGMFALCAVVVLWVLLTEEIYLYWYCLNRYVSPRGNWNHLAHMYISVMWAVYGAALMIIGFCLKTRMLRYFAMFVFGLLLAKVFIWDTREIPNEYRIAAFLATGFILVVISYIYQFLRKKGFFETAPTEDNRQ